MTFPRLIGAAAIACALLAAAPAPARAVHAIMPLPPGLLPLQPGAKRPGQLPTVTVSPAPEARIARAAGTEDPSWAYRAKAGLWLTPTVGGSANVDFSLRRPAWMLSGGVWKGDWGLEGALTAFNLTYAPFRAEPYFQPTTYMADALLSRRFAPGPYRLVAGVRTLGLGDLVLPTIGAGVERPFRDPRFRLFGRVQGGYHPRGDFYVDAQASVGFSWRFLEATAGIRHLSLQAVPDAVFTLTGPVVGLEGRF